MKFFLDENGGLLKRKGRIGERIGEGIEEYKKRVVLKWQKNRVTSAGYTFGNR